MKSRKRIEPGTCPAPEAVVAFVMEGEVGIAARAAADHIAQCETCQRLAEEALGTRDLLRMDADLPVRDLTADIMAKLPAEPLPRTAHHRFAPQLGCHAESDAGWGARLRRAVAWRTPLRIAAALAILMGTAYLLHRTNTPTAIDAPADAASQAVCAGRQWLLAQQRPSGGWDAATLGGHPEYAEALNGLAVMAIITADAPGNTDTLAALTRAGEYLLALQAPGGLISRDANAAMYNHGIATLALLEIQRVTGDTRLGAPIDKALATICSRQSPAGGWGYREDLASAPNTSITAWQVKALLQARAQGRDVPVPVLRKALNWMAGTVGPQGYFGYEGPQPQADNPATLTMMGAHCMLAARDADLMNDPRLEASVKSVVKRLAQQPPGDYHQSYFLAAVMEQLGATGPGTDAVAIRDILLARQTRTGTDAGAWQTVGDRWGTTGGKLYSTSMAMLALAR
jgi:hypothetical protein